MKLILWLSLTMCVLLSCSKLVDEISLQQKNASSAPAFIEYNIPQGNHYAQENVFRTLHIGELRFDVVFDSSAVYETKKPENQYDINKLYGFSDCETMHHENSARFGWRWNGRTVELYAYWYNDSTRHHQLLDDVSIGQTIELAITALPHQYQFSINKRTHFFPRYCMSTPINGYLLYPYFGGDETAPHHIRIRIKEFTN